MNLTLRIRGPGGTSSLQLSSDQSLAELKSKIEELTNIKAARQELRLGFPPQALSPSATSETTLSSLGFKNGEPVIVSELAEELPATPKPSTPQKRSAPTPAPTNPRPVPVPARADPSLNAPLMASSSFNPPVFVPVDGGYLVLRVVPDDNSCLFTAVGLVLEPGRKDAAPHLRKLVAESIRSDPDTWSDAVLGRPREDYISTILKPNSWGGAIELSIFSSHFRTELASIDVQTGRIDRFGQGEGYDSLALLVYSGIHYDSLTFSYVEPSPSSTFPPPNLEFDTTVFPTTSDDMVLAALKLVATLRASHAYTDAATFTLRCEVCQKAIVGEKEARAHAERSGHTQFGEYDG